MAKKSLTSIMNLIVCAILDLWLEHNHPYHLHPSPAARSPTSLVVSCICSNKNLLKGTVEDGASVCLCQCHWDSSLGDKLRQTQRTSAGVGGGVRCMRVCVVEGGGAILEQSPQLWPVQTDLFPQRQYVQGPEKKKKQGIIKKNNIKADIKCIKIKFTINLL